MHVSSGMAKYIAKKLKQIDRWPNENRNQIQIINAFNNIFYVFVFANYILEILDAKMFTLS